MKKQFFYLVMILTAACAQHPDPEPTSALWVKTAAEYRACGYQAYNAGRMHMETAAADPSWTAALEQTGDYFDLPPAVIFDIDETVLDNSLFQGWLALNRSEFQEGDWDRWGKLGRAGSIAGAVDFIRGLQDRGITVIFITNRSCGRQTDKASPCPQEADTLENLKTLGISGVTENHVLLRDEFPDWGSDKSSRRAFVAEKYRILMLFGDDLGDFIPHARRMTPEKRKEAADFYRDFWGEKWFILPNPMYGSWRRVLGEPVDQYLEMDF